MCGRLYKIDMEMFRKIIREGTLFDEFFALILSTHTVPRTVALRTLLLLLRLAKAVYK